MVTWTYHLDLKDVFHDEDRGFPQRRDEIVRRIRAAAFYDENDLRLLGIVEEMSEVESTREFDDGPWPEFYDYADARRIWVATF